MSEENAYTLDPIGIVRSPLQRPEDSPRQGLESAPNAWLEIFPRFAEAIQGILPGSEIVVLTWLHLSQRDVLKVHPQHDPAKPLTGVFATRSPNRPNPVGLHPVKVLEIDRQRSIKVDHLEAIDGTPIIDIKPILRGWRLESCQARNSI